MTTEGPRWVGRAAHKLVAALDTWAADGLSVTGRRCVDVGASTGGFTQVLLARGAARVVAVDVGHDQLVPEVAQDPRVDERSGTTVRGLTAARPRWSCRPRRRRPVVHLAHARHG